MATDIARQDFGPFRRGSTIDDIVVTVSINGSPPASPISAVAIDLRKEGERYHRYDSADSSITVDADDQFTIVKHVLDIERGDYGYDCRITFADGDIKTYFEGIWCVEDNYTKD